MQSLSSPIQGLIISGIELRNNAVSRKFTSPNTVRRTSLISRTSLEITMIFSAERSPREVYFRSFRYVIRFEPFTSPRGIGAQRDHLHRIRANIAQWQTQFSTDTPRWGPKVVMMPSLPPLMSPGIVFMATVGGTSNGEACIMTTRFSVPMTSLVCN